MTNDNQNTRRRQKARPDLDPLAKANRKEMSIAEQKLWTALRGRRFEGFKFRRQHPIGRFIVDFLCVDAHVAIEVDGESHDTMLKKDSDRTSLLNSLGYEVVRFQNEDVLFRFEGVLKDIFELCVSRGRTPSPRPSPPSTGARENRESP